MRASYLAEGGYFFALLRVRHRYAGAVAYEI